MSNVLGNAGNSWDKSTHLLLLHGPCTGDQAEIQLWDGMQDWKGPKLCHLLLPLSPRAGWLGALPCLCPPGVFAPLLCYLSSFHFLGLIFNFLVLLQSEPWSLLLPRIALCPPLGPEPPPAAPWKGRVLPGGEKGGGGAGISKRPTAQCGPSLNRAVQV